ncbi:hypothetical protein L1987_33005 [Smallanthus sonchifolius]|uniref:Uncharacterized protein n=1 Tax=Smallanthus sonchifolius TaxID=185202 RepID=A0ACB9HSF9_9ASTR|nr:hypothetical protein L1987_33005 [Smallanthus sonchifolius]
MASHTTLICEVSQLEVVRKIYSQVPSDQSSSSTKELLKAVDVRLETLKQDLATTLTSHIRQHYRTAPENTHPPPSPPKLPDVPPSKPTPSLHPFTQPPAQHHHQTILALDITMAIDPPPNVRNEPSIKYASRLPHGGGLRLHGDGGGCMKP